MTSIRISGQRDCFVATKVEVFRRFVNKKLWKKNKESLSPLKRIKEEAKVEINSSRISANALKIAC